MGSLAGEEAIAADEPRNKGLLASAAARPFQTGFGQELYGNVFEKGAALFHSLIANHPFFNGNKRTAVLALDHFLLANGYFLMLTNPDMYKLAKGTATYREKGISHDEIFRHVLGEVTRSVVSIRKLKKQVPDSFYQKVLAARRWIRRHEFNKHQP